MTAVGQTMIGATAIGVTLAGTNQARGAVMAGQARRKGAKLDRS